MSKSLPKNNTEKDLDTLYQEAFDKISKLKKGVAPDVMLRFYAYYKQANYGNNFTFNSGSNLISGFKFNAWMQLNGMSSEDAKREYIALANTILTDKNQTK
ncbi:acyl-CoA-binding protein [Polaribacter gangjinensis]|uniref:acyl-CoA-binding protein n=1 Tax=Polaribacter gangjinensis TaxID=574710 RepID=UPI001CFFF3C6|nr:acyl-CoA-binding protein [Polaribacter gangjinensis]